VSLLLASVDPLFKGGVTWVVGLIVLLKVLVGFGVLMGAVVLMIWFERKAISDMQSRIGPQRWGLSNIPDPGRRAQVDLEGGPGPEQADRFVFKLARTSWWCPR